MQERVKREMVCMGGSCNELWGGSALPNHTLMLNCNCVIGIIDLNLMHFVIGQNRNQLEMRSGALNNRVITIMLVCFLRF